MTVPMIRFDLRSPEGIARATPAEQYRACLEMCEWADAHDFASVILSEHHGVDDGYLPAPLTLAAAVAGRTRSILISVAAVLVPFHDPVRLAEQIAVLDLASGGRISVVAGLGYRREEFEMAGVDPRGRGELVEEYVDVLRRAWTGEPFEWRGRTVRVTPRPVQRPHPPVILGGSTSAAARRAARLRLPFFPAVGDPALADIYDTECRARGFEGGSVVLPSGPGFVHVTEDPEKAWAQIGPHALYDARTYHAWQTTGQRSQVDVDATSLDGLRRSGVYAVVTPDECLELARTLGDAGTLLFHPLMGGMEPDIGWASLELFASQVAPRLS